MPEAEYLYDPENRGLLLQTFRDRPCQLERRAAHFAQLSPAEKAGHDFAEHVKECETCRTGTTSTWLAQNTIFLLNQNQNQTHHHNHHLT